MNDSSPRPAPSVGPIRRLIAGLPPLAGPPVEQDLRDRGFTGPIRRMHLNECPLPPSPAVLRALQAAAAEGNRYPDSKWRALVRRLAANVDLPADRIILGNGSDQLIQSLADITVEPGVAAVAPEPSFPRYAVATRQNGGEVVLAPVRADGVNDVEALLRAVTPATRVLFACSPNNPTGGMLTGAEIRHLAEATPADVLLVLDEAYHEFAVAAGGPDGLAAMRRRRGHWAVLRTFSKAYALAGLRVGYALCSGAEVAGALDKVRQSFHVNALAQAAALAALDDPDYSRRLVAEVSAERDRLAAAVAGMGHPVLPSAGNFVTARMPVAAAPVVQGFVARGIMIGAVRTPTPGFENHIRVTVDRPEDNDAFLAALPAVLTSIGAGPGLS